MRKVWLLAAALCFALPSAAFDPRLIDRLLSDDPVERQQAYSGAAALAPPDKLNLAPSLASQLEDPVRGERAALALCRLAAEGVPFLEQHARASRPGSEFAYMGLLMNADGGWQAAANVLRNGDVSTVMKALDVIAASKTLPPHVSAEVARLSTDDNAALADAARAALAEVEAAKSAKASAPSGPNFSSDQSLADYIRSMEETVGAALSAPSPTPEQRNKFDGSGYRSRQSPSSLFRKNASE